MIVMPKKSPNSTDKHVGSRVRMRRMMLEMSQTELGNDIGLTFQQVQKYEKGTNRNRRRLAPRTLALLEGPDLVFFRGLAARARRACVRQQQRRAAAADLR